MDNNPSVAPTPTSCDHEPITGPTPSENAAETQDDVSTSLNLFTQTSQSSTPNPAAGASSSSSTPTTDNTQEPTPVPAIPIRPEQNWTIKKVLNNSDIGNCKGEKRPDSILFKYRIEKAHILDNLDDTSSEKLKSDKKKCKINVYDCDEQVEFQLTLKPYDTEGKSYALGKGWIENFINRRYLKAGDQVGFQMDAGNRRLLFSVLSRHSSSTAVATDDDRLIQVLRKNDCGKRYRSRIGTFAFHKGSKLAEKILQSLDQNKVEQTDGVEINVVDADKGGDFKLTLRTCPSLVSSYELCNGWMENFVKRRELQPDDQVEFRWDANNTRLIFRVISRKKPDLSLKLG